MIDITTKYDEELGWLAMTSESPYMCVSGVTEEIARSVVEKALLWHAERAMKQREREVLSALSEIVKIDPSPEFVDTAPSEMSIYEEYPNEGC